MESNEKNKETKKTTAFCTLDFVESRWIAEAYSQKKPEKKKVKSHIPAKHE